MARIKVTEKPMPSKSSAHKRRKGKPKSGAIKKKTTNKGKQKTQVATPRPRRQQHRNCDPDTSEGDQDQVNPQPHEVFFGWSKPEDIPEDSNTRVEEVNGLFREAIKENKFNLYIGMFCKKGESLVYVYEKEILYGVANIWNNLDNKQFQLLTKIIGHPFHNANKFRSMIASHSELNDLYDTKTVDIRNEINKWLAKGMAVMALLYGPDEDPKTIRCRALVVTRERQCFFYSPYVTTAFLYPLVIALKNALKSPRLIMCGHGNKDNGVLGFFECFKFFAHVISDPGWKTNPKHHWVLQI